MTHWIVGELDGTYAGAPVGEAGMKEGRRFAITIQRALIRNPRSIEDPDEVERLDHHVLRQDVLEDALFPPEPGTRAWQPTPLYALRVTGVRLSRATEVGGRAYGKVTGVVVARTDRPPPIAREPAPSPQQPGPKTDARAEPVDEPAAERPVDEVPVADAAEERAEPEEPAVPIPERPPISRRFPPRHDPAPEPGPPPRSRTGFGMLLLIAFVIAVGGVLWMQCGPRPAIVWWVGMGVALVIRGTLRRHLSSPGATAVLGWVTVAVQWFWILWLVFDWSRSGCYANVLTDLVWVVGPVVICAALPWTFPVVASSLGLAIALFTWCGQAGRCVEEPASGTPTVANPGKPRTDPDGSWPRLPGRDDTPTGPGRGVLPAPAGAAGVEDAGGAGGGGGEAERARHDAAQTPAPGATARAPIGEDVGEAAAGEAAAGEAAAGADPAVEAPTGETAADDVPADEVPARPGKGSAGEEPIPAAEGPHASAPGGGVPRPPDPTDFQPPPIRRTSSSLLIPVEQALRTPEAFFEGRGRLVLPTDPIFGTTGGRVQDERELRRLATLLRTHPEYAVAVEVHTDAIGGDSANQELSRRRALAMRLWLVGEGRLDPRQVRAVGLGATLPIVPPTGDRNQQRRNRRAEVRLIGGIHR